MDHGVHRSTLHESQHAVDDGKGGVDAHCDIDGNLKAPLRRQSEIEQEERLFDDPVKEHPVNLLDEQPLYSLLDRCCVAGGLVSYLRHFLQLTVW